MNEKALEIGMKKTTFINPHGLDEDKVIYQQHMIWLFLQDT